MDGLAEVNCIGAHLDRQADFSNHVASVRANDHIADDAVRLLVDDQLGHAKDAPEAIALPEAAHGNFADLTCLPEEAASCSMMPTQATSGSV